MKRLAGSRTLAQWIIPLGAIVLAQGLYSPEPASAIIQRMYTFPFYDSYTLGYGWHGYYDPVVGWHEGTDYELGERGAGGQRVFSAAAGTAKTCPENDLAGLSVVIDHGNGHRTRYLHLNGYAVADGQKVGRRGLIGYEGSTGYTDPDGFNHLHFETRHGATQFTCNIAVPADGTPEDPYGGSTYMWLTNPVSYALKTNDFNADGFSDSLAFNTQERAIVGMNRVSNVPPVPNFEPLVDRGGVFAWGQIPSTGDFNRDGFTDTISFAHTTEEAIIGINVGTFTLENWGRVFAAADLPQVGDFNGDGYSDTIAFNTQGKAIVGINQPSQKRFDLQDWGNVFWYGGPDIPLLGDVNADGRTDTITFNTLDRAIVGINQGNRFVIYDWGRVFSFAWGEIPSTGDFNGDGLTDTFARTREGRAIIGINWGNRFVTYDWGEVGRLGEVPLVGHYDWNWWADTQSFNNPNWGGACSRAIVALGNGGAGFHGLGDWGRVGCGRDIPAGFQSFAYERRWDRWFGFW